MKKIALLAALFAALLIVSWSNWSRRPEVRASNDSASKPAMRAPVQVIAVEEAAEAVEEAAVPVGEAAVPEGPRVDFKYADPHSTGWIENAAGRVILDGDGLQGGQVGPPETALPDTMKNPAPRLAREHLEGIE